MLSTPPSSGLRHLPEPQEPSRTRTLLHFKLTGSRAPCDSAWASPAHLARSRAQGTLTCWAATGSWVPGARPVQDPPRLRRLWGAGWGWAPPRGARVPLEERWRRGAAGGRGLAGSAAPGGGRAGNVACAPGNAPIALTQRRALSVWSLLTLMETDSAAGAGRGRGRGAGSGGGGSPAPGDSRDPGAQSLYSTHRGTGRSSRGQQALTSHPGKGARRPELGRSRV